MTDEGKIKWLEATLREIVDAIEPLAVTMGAYAALSRAAVALMSERLGIPADEMMPRRAIRDVIPRARYSCRRTVPRALVTRWRLVPAFRDRALALIDVPPEEAGPVAALMDAILETSAAPVPLAAARH